MTEYVYKLENFDTPLENSKMIFLLGQSAAAALPCIFDDLVNSPKLVSRILIANQRSELPLLFKAPWSAVFSPVDGKDWQLVLTYCLYMTRPAIIVIEDGVQVPEGFMSRLSAAPAATNLQIVTCRLLQGLQGLQGNQLASADTIFLPLVEDLTGADADACLAVLKGQLGSSGAPFEQKREWLREVRSAKAALVWTRLRERGAGGAVYWFDPADGTEGAKQPVKQVKKLLKSLTEIL